MDQKGQGKMIVLSCAQTLWCWFLSNKILKAFMGVDFGDEWIVPLGTESPEKNRKKKKNKTSLVCEELLPWAL